MSHPDRKKLRKRRIEEMLEKRNTYDVKDLTAYNAGGQIVHGSFSIKYK